MLYKYSNNIFTVQIPAPPLNNQKSSQNIPPKIQRPVPHPSPRGNISSVRKAPDPGRLLTKDPHPFPVAVSFLRSLHVVPLAPAARPPSSPGSHLSPRPLASPFAPTFGLAIPRPPPSHLVRRRSLAPLALSSPVGSPSPPGQTDQNYPISPHHPNTPKIPLPATIHVLNIYE